MEESESKKYRESRLNELNISVENIKEEFPAPQRPSTFKKGLIGFYGNDSYLIYNISLMTDEMIAENKCQLFVMDKSDVEYFENPSGGNIKFEMLKNLENFMSFKPDKKIYLRVFKPFYQGFEIDHIFKDEVLTVLPMVLKQQGDLIPTESIEALRPGWTDKTGYHGPTMKILPFSVLLSQTFDIDAGLITLVNDLSLTWSCHASLDNGGRTTVRFQNQDGKYMQHPSHAAFTFFQSWICGTNCNDKLTFEASKHTCLMQMLEYDRIEQDLMILDLQVDLSLTTNDLTDYDFRLPGLHYNETILISLYVKTCKEYGIPNYREQIERNDGKMEVYLARALMIVGWMELVFGDDREMYKARDLLIDGFSCVIPKDKLDDFQNFLKSVVFPTGLYSRNKFLTSGLVDPNKEENDLIARLAAANEKRNKKLQEKKNAKKKKTKQGEPEKTEPQYEGGTVNPEIPLQFLAKQLELIYAANSAQYVDEEDLNNACNSNDVEVVEESSEAPTEGQAKSSKKKNNKKKKKRQAASEDAAKRTVEEDELAVPEETVVESEEPVPHSDTPEAANPEIAEPEAVEPVVAEPNHPPPAPRDFKKESSSCSKCSRTSKKCQEAVKAATIAQSKADNFESKARRTEEVEKKMKEMEEEIRQMKLQLATHSKHSEENERLRQKITKREKIEEVLRSEKKELIIKNESLEMEVGNLKEESKKLEDKIEHEKLEMEKRIALIESVKQEVVNVLTSKTYTQEEEITNLKELMSQKQAEHFKAMEINGKLHMENSLLKSKMRRLENDIEKLREHASQALEPVVMDRRKLLELRKLKDDFGKNKIMEEAREKVDKIKTLPDTTENLAEVLEAAENELIRLETSIYNYQDLLDLNVRIYQKSHDISKILELPEYPKISDGFSDLYSRLFPVRPPVTGIPDTDCPICYEPRLPEEEVLDCNGCPYIFHISCLRTWFKDKPGCTVCPQCQQPLRDPDQYPALG